MLLAAGAAAATAVGFAAGSAALLPLLGAAVAYPFYYSSLRHGRPGRAVVLMICWALFLSVATVVATAALPERAAQTVWRGPEYTSEMLHWIATGEGAEGSPSIFLPQHATHFAIFCAACLATGGLAGLYMGAALLNYMNYYVAELALGASDPATAAALGWPPWAVIRVLGFIIASIPLSAVVLGRIWGYSKPPKLRYYRYYLCGILLVVLDAALKTALAPHWRQLLLKSL